MTWRCGKRLTLSAGGRLDGTWWWMLMSRTVVVEVVEAMVAVRGYTVIIRGE